MARNQIKQAVAYLRANDGSAAKLEAQRQRIAAWAAKTETVIGSWHLEVGSGTAEMRHRPGLLKALAGIELGGAQVLVVAHSRRDDLRGPAGRFCNQRAGPPQSSKQPSDAERRVTGEWADHLWSLF